MKIKTQNSHPKNFLLVLFETGSNYNKRIDRLETKSSRRFWKKVKLLNSQIECFLRVSYADGGVNSGYYSGKLELIEVLKAFCER